MKLQFKVQKFQSDAAKAIVDVFAGQPYITPTYMMDRGDVAKAELMDDDHFIGHSNQKIIPELTNEHFLSQIQKVQRNNQIKPSTKLEGRFNLTVEMETGVGKTYTYIKTMYELNRAYGWSKFIVVVPSIAIREGVYKSFQITQDHFVEEYGTKIRFFVYNSARLTEVDRFASDSAINVMIINIQAFNARGKDARRIDMELDEFRSRRPIDVIAKTNPIVIIDEPQSVEGKVAKESLKKFCPLMTLRYSATHKADSLYNLVYRLDAMEAYNKHLVKRIAVKGLSESGSTASEGYLYLEKINCSAAAPTASLQFDCKTKSGVRQVTRIVNEGYNLYDQSEQLEEYKDGYVVSKINGLEDSIEFVNGIKLYAGDVKGKVSEDQLRRIQIRETLLSHLQRERELFHRGIKVLSLFFIDEVAKYRQYDEAGQPVNGLYARMFEEEYKEVFGQYQMQIGEDAYDRYLESIAAEDTHAGYFSIDKKGKMVNSETKKKETISDDVDAYDLIMKNKELLLDRDPKRSPVRFIFSHSALREGWDNPNVFQICTLKQASSEIRKRQEVGRGLRLCVNQHGERMDSSVLDEEVHQVNVLTVIASESYDSFARGLQTELADAVADRPVRVTANLFDGKNIKDKDGNEFTIDPVLAGSIYFGLRVNDYITAQGELTDKYYEDKKNGCVQLTEEVAEYTPQIVGILDTVYDARSMQPENARSNNVELHVKKDKLEMHEFKALWEKINSKSVYVVKFDSDELVEKAVSALDRNLRIAPVYVAVKTGSMKKIESRNDLLSGLAFDDEERGTYQHKLKPSNHVKYDLVGKLVESTGLTRKTVIRILQGIQPSVFNQFKDNPEEFILKAGQLINDEKATSIIEHITYNVLEDKYDKSVFTDSTIKGKLNVNAMKAQRHLYDHIVYDSTNEKEFATQLDTCKDIAVYVKLPKGFFISTPLGKYNPDWAIAFKEGTKKHIYFVAETKGSMNTLDLRLAEHSKIHCAREHFRAISNEQVTYDVVDSYQALLEKVMR